MSCVTVSISAGSFTATTTATFSLAQPVSVAHAGIAFTVPVTGSTTLQIDARGSIRTIEVGAIHLEGIPQLDWKGDVVRDQHGSTIWIVPPSHTPGVQAPDPTATPTVQVIGIANASLSLGDTEAFVRSLLEVLGPGQVWEALNGLANKVPDAIVDDVRANLDEIADQIGTVGFPFLDQLGQAARNSIRAALRTLVAGLVTKVRMALHSAWCDAAAGLRDALRGLCRRVIDSAVDHGADLVRLAAAALRAAQVTAHEVAGLLADGLGRFARQSEQHARAALRCGADSMDVFAAAGPAGIRHAVVALLGAVHGHVDTLAAEVALLLQAGAQRIAAKAGTASAAAATLLAFLQSTLVDFATTCVEASADALAAVLLAMADVLVAAAVSTIGVVTASLLSATVQVARSADALTGLLAALFARIAAAARWSKAQLIAFLRNLADNELLKRVAQWMHDAWLAVVAAVMEGIDDLREWIDQLAGFVREAPAEVAAHFARLKTLFHWLHQLPATVFDAPELANVRADLDRLASIRQQGWIAWLHEQAAARSTTMAALARHLLGEGNALLGWFRRIGAELDELLGSVQAQGDAWYDAAQARLVQFEQFERDLNDVVFAGAAGEGAFSVAARMHGVVTGAIEAVGADLVVGRSLTEDSLITAGEDIVAGLSTQLASDVSFLALEGRREPLRIPPPTEPGGVVWSESNVRYVDVPTAFPLPYHAAVAVAHLPELWVIDMRYHMPYGDLARYWSCDRDGDGKVVAADVEAVRRAVGKDDAYADELDPDGDGKVTAADLQLAIEQQSRLLNGLMWRPTTAGLSFFVQPTPDLWAHLTFGVPIQDDGIPGRLERRGLLNVFDAQLVLPGIAYPLRAHLEERLYMDRFPRLDVLGLPWPGFPSTRYDLVVVGGATARDFQLYASAEPWNPLLRTWTVKGSLCLRGMISGAYFGVGAEVGAGVAGRADLRLHFVYESGANLVEVLGEWHDRFESLRGRDIRDLPVPWKVVSAVLEYTEIPRLCRAFIGIAGPLLDLLFDWTDPKRHVRAVLGHIHQTVLEGWTPCATWDEIADAIERLPEDKVSPSMRAAALGAATGLRSELGVSGEAPMCWRARLMEKVKAALLAVVGATDIEKRLAAGLVEGICRRTPGVAGLDQLIEPSTALPGLLPKDARNDLGLGGDIARPRNVVGQDASTVSIPGLGDYMAFDPHVWQVPSQDMVEHWDTIVGNPLRRPIYNSTVVFPPYAVLYAAPKAHKDLAVGKVAVGAKGVVAGVCALEDGDGAWWFFVRTDGKYVRPGQVNLFSGKADVDVSAPEITGTEYGAVRIDGPKLRTKAEVDLDPTLGEDEATVQRRGRVVAEDAFHGWLRVTAPDIREQVRWYGQTYSELAVRAILPPDLEEGFDAVFGRLPAARAAAGKLLDEEDRARLDEAWEGATRGAQVTRFLPSPVHTVDDARWARLAREALTRVALGRGSEDDHSLATVHEQCMAELRARVFGAGAGEAADVAPIVRKLPADRQARFWLHASAWLKCMYYVPRMATDLVERIAPPLFQGRLQELPGILHDVLGQLGDFTAEEAARAAQAAMPYVKEAVLAIVEMCQKMRSAASFFQSGGKGKGRVDERLDTADTDPEGPTIGNLGAYLFRLFMDDAGTPGAKKQSEAKRKHGASFDSDVGISAGYESKGIRPRVPDWPDEATYRQQVGEDAYAATCHMSWADRRAWWEEETYRIEVGDDGYAATRQMTWPEREEYWRQAAERQRKGESGEPDASKVDNTYAKGDVQIDFGRDKLGFGWSLEAGGGAAVGVTAGAGSSAAPTGNARLHYLWPKFNVSMLKEPDYAAIALRFFGRYLHHSLAVIDLEREWLERPLDLDDKAIAFVGTQFWSGVFAVLAVKEALNDIANDHAPFVTAMLESLEFEFGFDLTVSASGEVGVGIDGSAAIKARGKVSLATLLAPVLDVLLSGSRPSDSGASILDRIAPHIDFVVDDRVQCKVHAAIGALEVESASQLLRAALTIPKDSPLRADWQRLGRTIEDAIFLWRDQHAAAEHPWLEKGRLLLDAIDAQILGMLQAWKGRSVDAAFASASELVQRCVAMLRNETPPAPAEPRTEITRLLAMLRSTRLRGVQVGVGPIVIATDADPGNDVAMHVDDAEKDAVAGSGWSPPAAPTPVGEQCAWRVRLPVGPATVAWGTYNEPRTPTFVQGLIAGFESVADARSFVAQRDVAWVEDAVQHAVWTREARHWAWIDTDLVPALGAAGVPLPEVRIEGNDLLLAFPLVDAAALAEHAPALLASGHKILSKAIWKLKLMPDASADEVDQVRGQVSTNRDLGAAVSDLGRGVV